MSSNARGWDPSLWADWRPFGIGAQRPNNFAEVFRAMWENRDNLGYAWRILKDGVCDGCALGTSGMTDWTLDGVHLCNIRLRLLRLSTMGAADPSVFTDAKVLEGMGQGAMRALGRIPEPMIRRAGDEGFSPLSWDEALDLWAERILETSPERLAFYLTSRGIPNETYYLAQKAARALGTNSVDNAARVCHAPSTTGLKASLGVAATTCSYTDWIDADLVVFVGANPANNQPVAMKYLYHARRAGTRIAVVNNFREPGMERYWIPSITESALFGTKMAEHFFLVHIGGDVAFLLGVFKHLVEQRWENREFVDGHTVGFDAASDHARACSFEELERLSGATSEDMLGLARLLAESERAVLVWSMGITQHEFGVDGVRAIINLALARGFVGREGCGLMPIRGHSGVQGGAEMGAYSTVFPGGRAIGPESAREMESLWGFAVPDAPGRTAPEMVDAAAAGEVDVLFSAGGNFLDVLPEPHFVRDALTRVRTRVHMDIVFSPQMLVPAAGEVLVLPASTRYEIEGGVTETTTERRVIFSPEIPGPRVSGARAEGEVLLDLARRVRPDLAEPLAARPNAEVRAEIARVIPTYAGIESLAEKGDQFQYGGPHLCADGRFPLPEGRARFAVLHPPKPSVPEGWFAVTTRRGKQFNSIVHERADALTGATREAVLMAAEDADALGFDDGTRIRLSNDVGTFVGQVLRARVRPGNVQVHWPEGNVLIDRRPRAPGAGIPAYTAAARVEREP